jgi:sugar lactone lactonase YvrE
MLATRKLLGLVLGAFVLAAPALAQPFPDLIHLPTGFQPEGIARGHGPTFFVGSIPTGAVFRGDLRTGEGEVLVPGQAGRSAIGLEVDQQGRVFVAGGPTGGAWVYDGQTGEELAAYQLATGGDPTFVNDVVVTGDAAWFTGDFELVPGEFNTNGIETTPDRSRLVIVQSITGMLLTVDPETGVTDEIELTGGDASFGDGLLRRGTTLYVVQNQLNRIEVIELTSDGGAGTVVAQLTDADLDVPTTVAWFGSALYAVNSRFGNASPETADYAVVRVET